MDITLKYADGQEVVLPNCTATLLQHTEDVWLEGDRCEVVNSGQPSLTVEVPMDYANVSWTTQPPLGIYSTSGEEVWKIGSGFVRVGEQEQQVERRDKMISRRVFNEALAEEGISKADRRKVEKLSDADFDYLIATLLAKAFDSEMLKVFEPDVQKVEVVEKK